MPSDLDSFYKHQTKGIHLLSVKTNKTSGAEMLHIGFGLAKKAQGRELV